MNPPTASDWLQKTLQNLAREGFVISENVSHSDAEIKVVARRTRFEHSFLTAEYTLSKILM